MENSNQIDRKIVFVIVPPAYGHVNPVSGLVYELCKQPNVDVIFYGQEPFREIIEKTGAKYRAYSNFDPDSVLCKTLQETTEPSVLSLISLLIDRSYVILPQLIKDFYAYKPDLIIYDSICLPAKYLLEYLKEHNLDKNTKSLYFLPSFASNSEIMKDLMNSWQKRLWILIRGVYLSFKQVIFSWTFGLKIANPLGFLFRYRNDMKICAVFPELQPNVDMFDKSFNFVGACIIENLRRFSHLDSRLKSVLDTVDSNNDQKLIYVSMGTVFNNNVFVYDTIISAFDQLARQDPATSRHLTIVVSLGEENMKSYEARISQGYRIPHNVYLFARVPQLELLQRASLFITHAGMNSTSEAIEYAVPLVCVPLQADQPVVAKRVCDQLRLGVRLNPLKMSPDDVVKAVLEVINNHEYKDNIVDLSKVSKRYNGAATAASLVMKYLGEVKFTLTN